MSRDDSVYLVHFDQPIGDTASKFGYAQHYTGSTPDLMRRLAKHQAAPDAKIMQAVQQAGIGWVLARTWPGGRIRERQIKRQGGASRHCPVCKGNPPAAEISFRAVPRPGRPAGPLWAVVEAAPPAVPQPRRPAELAAESEPLWESVAARLEPAQAAVFVAELAAAERAAWTAAKVGAPDYEARFATACDLSRLRGAEASAIERLAEERAIAEAEGWQAEADVRDLDREAG